MSLKSTIPDIRGRWYYINRILYQENILVLPTFANQRTREYLTEIEQEGQFVIIKILDPSEPPLKTIIGVLHESIQNNVSTWNLTLVDNLDNGVRQMQISDIDSGFITKWSGVYSEGGFSYGNPEQEPAVGLVTLTKITPT